MWPRRGRSPGQRREAKARRRPIRATRSHQAHASTRAALPAPHLPVPLQRRGARLVPCPERGPERGPEQGPEQPQSGPQKEAPEGVLVRRVAQRRGLEPCAHWQSRAAFPLTAHRGRGPACAGGLRAAHRTNKQAGRADRRVRRSAATSPDHKHKHERVSRHERLAAWAQCGLCVFFLSTRRPIP